MSEIDIYDDKQCFYKKSYVPVPEEDEMAASICQTPQSIFDFLDESVYGHYEYKKALSIFFWKAFKKHRPKGALLIAGASGTGKTEMLRAIQNGCYSNIYIMDGSSVSPQAYKGNLKLYSGLQNLDLHPDALMPILVIDEFDKIVIKHQNGWNDTSLIPELYKLLEGGNVNIGTEEKPRIVNTSEIGFILLGAFSNISDVTTKEMGFGGDITPKRTELTKEAIFELIPPELQGRIEQTVILDKFDEGDYLNILTDKRYSPIRKIEEEFGICLKVSDERTRQISHDAFVNETGVRSMNNSINEFVNNSLFKNPEVKTLSMQ